MGRRAWAYALILAACGSDDSTDSGGGNTLPPRGDAGQGTGTAPPPPPPPPPPAASCTDGAKNGAETDVDCGGGTCGACAIGKKCSLARDCTTNDCTTGTCCMKSSSMKTTGSVSGSKEICCDAGGTITMVTDCGTGSNHTAKAENSMCALAQEGAGNGGNACAQITCAYEVCSATDAGM